MKETLRTVRTIEVTKAVNATDVGGVQVGAGQYMALLDDVVTAVEDAPELASKSALNRLGPSKELIVTLYWGAEVAQSCAEHRLARLVQVGVRQSRYFGRAKTRFQLLLAATVANLTPAATKMGIMSQAPGSSQDRPEDRLRQHATDSPVVAARFIWDAAFRVALGPVHCLSSTSFRHSRAFQPGC